ncbi:FAD-dependent oxidoreductase [Actinacidiphila glaucinigra]|uniref:FAD-dependent oxidoreductase n=1 Tax=Actinacidiphila glaucinigra TaxID=235986 RepID=UPI00366BD6FA
MTAPGGAAARAAVRRHVAAGTGAGSCPPRGLGRPAGACGGVAVHGRAGRPGPVRPGHRIGCGGRPGHGRVPWCGPRWASRIGPAGEAGTSGEGHGPAVVGAGPAGIAAALDAADAGLRVALVDAVPQAGGRFGRQPALPGPPGSRRGRRM